MILQDAMSLPTVEQVREHAERYPIERHPRPGGLWMLRWQGFPPAPSFRVLSVDAGRVIGYWSDEEERAAEVIPCDQSGYPLPLVEERDGWKRAAESQARQYAREAERRTEERARAEQAEQERDRLLHTEIERRQHVAELTAERDSLRGEIAHWQEAAVNAAAIAIAAVDDVLLETQQAIEAATSERDRLADRVAELENSGDWGEP